jgi:hypothetical protein
VSYRGNAQRRPNSTISSKVAESQLAMLLANATDEKVAAMTVVSLGKMYRVQPRLIETMLLAAQGTRIRNAKA